MARVSYSTINLVIRIFVLQNLVLNEKKNVDLCKRNIKIRLKTIHLQSMTDLFKLNKKYYFSPI